MIRTDDEFDTLLRRALDEEAATEAEAAAAGLARIDAFVAIQDPVEALASALASDGMDPDYATDRARGILAALPAGWALVLA